MNAIARRPRRACSGAASLLRVSRTPATRGRSAWIRAARLRAAWASPWLAVASALCQVACTVGPDYARPSLAPPETWTGLGAAVDGTRPTSVPVAGAAELARWWSNLGDPHLSALVERAALGNLDLVAAEARLRAARARRGIAIGGLYPTVDATAGAAHAPLFDSADGVFSDNQNLFAAGFDASWELDVFGRVRRGIEATDAGVVGARADLRDTWVTLAAEVASTYIGVRAAQEQRRTVEANLAAQRETLALTQRLFEAGLVGALDVANATALVESTSSRLPTIAARVREQMYTLAVLLGQGPGALVEELETPAPIPSPPERIPVGLPSELLLRRPDIRSAEAELHAATARVGVAVADQFPRFALSAAIGVQNSDFSNFVSLATRYWSVGASAVWPLFEGGRIQSNIALQKAAADEALAGYRKRVLVALQEVEVALVNFQQEQARRAALTRTVAANQDAVGLATELYTAGRTDFLNVLTVQRSLLDSQEALARSDQVVTDNLIALYKALGGGWEGAELDPAGQESGAELPGSATRGAAGSVPAKSAAAD